TPGTSRTLWSMMRTRIRRLLATSVAALAVASLPLASPTPASALPAGTRVQLFKGGLDFPIDMAWVPGTRKIFFTEKNTGKIRVMVGRDLLDAACVDLDVHSSGESGALGIVLHPRFKTNHKLYVYYTNATPLENRVSSFIVENNRCTNRRNIITGIRYGGGYHNGGQLEFVGGKLFVATGEAHEPAEAQDTNNRLGKILRYNGNGTIPKGNPFNSQILGRNPVWSYGHRNPFGLAHKPGTTKIYSSENGPSCDDEVNFIVAGRNYGWGPNYQCGTPGVGINPKPPIRRYSDVIVPTDMTWYAGRLKALRGLLMGDYGTGRIHRFVLNDSASAVRDEKIVLDAGSGVLDVSIGPGRWLYFLTSSAILRVVRT
ncbi:MAG: PQQ-dependent sugar dehydrogenase, partial [Actinomycetota bacterium]|nr:PQQ-dependent sugar dehydrogenase [Actinomycetota bacterium]